MLHTSPEMNYVEMCSATVAVKVAVKAAVIVALTLSHNVPNSGEMHTELQVTRYPVLYIG